MNMNKEEVIKMIKEAMTTNLNLHGDRMLEPEEVVFHYLNEEGLFFPDKVYGLNNNIGEVLERYIEVERILNSEEEKLDDESYAALGFVYDGLKEIFKGKKRN